VGCDPAGNLTVGEAGRQYTYDAYDRLTQVRGGAVMLANYTYDALGRRAVFEDPVRGTTVRYTYDGSNVIEERDAADALVRYHVNGAQFADERIATWTADAKGSGWPTSSGGGGLEDSPGVAWSSSPQASAAMQDAQPTAADPQNSSTRAGTFTYYLGGNNFSVVGTGNADGSTLTRLDYSATGDFAGGGSPGTWYAHDADDDGDVDAEDFADFQLCFGTTDAGCRSVHDVDIDGLADGHIDLADYESFWGCCGGPGVSPGLSAGHDWEPDGDVDLADWAEFQVCFGTTTPACLAAFDLDASGQSNGVINLADVQGFERRMNGPNQPPGGACPVLGARWAARATPPSGTFALHGRAIDVLADGLVLQDFRNRVYAPQHGRWLQRDPTGYSDGPDLYEAFGNNATANTDPFGTQAEEEGLWESLWQRYFTPEGQFEYATQGLGVTGPVNPAQRIVFDAVDVRVRAAAVVAEKAEPVVARAAGGVQVVGGLAETGTGVALIVVSEGLGAAPGTAFLIHGPDVTQAGWRQMCSGRFTPTETYTVIAEAGYPTLAFAVDTGISVGSGVGLGSLPVGATAPLRAMPGRALARVESAYQRTLVAAFDTEPGKVILGCGPSPGEVPQVRVLRISPRGAIPAELSGTQAAFVAELAGRAKRWGIRRGLAGWGRTIGREQHEYAKKLLLRFQSIYGDRGLAPEVRYYGGNRWLEGMPVRGSVELDVVEGAVENPTVIYDYKFGTQGLQPKYVNELMEAGGFSENVLIVEVRPWTNR
jgi:RHS repeat-associated protein